MPASLPYAREKPCDRLKFLWANPREGDASFAFRLDEAGVAKNVEVMRQRAWCARHLAPDVAHGDRAGRAAVAFSRPRVVCGFASTSTDALEDRKTRRIRKSLESLQEVIHILIILRPKSNTSIDNEQ